MSDPAETTPQGEPTLAEWIAAQNAAPATPPPAEGPAPGTSGSNTPPPRKPPPPPRKPDTPPPEKPPLPLDPAPDPAPNSDDEPVGGEAFAGGRRQAQKDETLHQLAEIQTLKDQMAQLEKLKERQTRATSGGWDWGIPGSTAENIDAQAGLDSRAASMSRTAQAIEKQKQKIASAEAAYDQTMGVHREGSARPQRFSTPIFPVHDPIEVAGRVKGERKRIHDALRQTNTRGGPLLPYAERTQLERIDAQLEAIETEMRIRREVS